MQQEILKSFESGKVLVFPTEVSARSNLDSFVRETGGVCFADRAVSWDTFLRESRPIPKNMKKAAFQHRLLFAQRFAGEGDLNGTLKYFMPSGVGDTKAFVKPLAVALPHFFRLDGNRAKEMLPATCAHDIDIVLPLYRKFLDENGLYEEEAYEPDFGWAKDSHVIVYPQACADSWVEKAVGSGIETVDVPADCRTEIHRYANSVCEVRALMRSIRTLMENGTPSNSITITCAVEEYRPHLEEEAQKRGIRLEFASGGKLSEYSVARVFGQLCNLHSSGMEFGAFRKFVSDPVIPFKDRKTLLEMLRSAIDNKISFSPDRWHAKLDRRFMDTFRRLESYARGFATATSFDKLTTSFRGFQDDFLTEGGFGSLEDHVQVAAFERCMEVLEELDNMQRTMGPAKIHAASFFNDVLSATMYAPKADKAAIQVYSYPVTCPPAASHSFVVGLTDEASQTRRSPIPFYTSLDDGFEKSTGSRDITGDIVRAYADENVRVTCAEATFSGAASVPSAFLLDGGKVIDEKQVREDEFSIEEKAWKEGTVPAHGQPSALQANWNERGVATFASTEEAVPQADDPVKLSATSIAEYEKCPYRWLCKYGFKAYDEDLDCIQTNAAEIGELLHNTYERFMRKWKYIDSMSSKEALDDLQAIFEEELDVYAGSHNGPDSLHIMRIRNEQKDGLGRIVDAAGFSKLEGSEYAMSEGRMEYQGDGVHMHGFPDCILKTPGGTYAVVDFKKKTVDKDSMQLAMYASLMEHDERFGSVPEKAMFYNIAEGRFIIQWDSLDAFTLLKDDFEKRLSSFVEALRNGKFQPEPSKNDCLNCPYRQICRRRYVVK